MLLSAINDTRERRKKFLKAYVLMSHVVNLILIVCLVGSAAYLLSAPYFCWEVQNRLLLAFGALIYIPVACFLLFLGLKARKEMKKIQAVHAKEEALTEGDATSQNHMN